MIYDLIYIKFQTSNLIHEFRDSDCTLVGGMKVVVGRVSRMLIMLLFIELDSGYRDVFIWDNS